MKMLAIGMLIGSLTTGAALAQFTDQESGARYDNMWGEHRGFTRSATPGAPDITFPSFPERGGQSERTFGFTNPC